MPAQTYRDRDVILRDIGFARYADYLESDLWKSIRARAIALHGDKCRLCGQPANRVHHLGYGKAVLLGLSLKPLVPLCDYHHHVIEFDGDGSKRTLSQAHTRYVQLWKVVKAELKKTLEGRKSMHGRCRTCGDKLRKNGGPCRSCLKRKLA